MDWNLRGVALVFLIALVAASAGSPVCPRPSAGDSILGRPDSCWDLDPTAVLRGYQIGVVEGDEAVLQKALSIVQKNREEYVALLFYASWCVGPSSVKSMSLDKFVDPPNDTEPKEDMPENCPFSWARSPEKLLQQDGYLALASCFLLMRLLNFLLPSLNACLQRAWRRQIRYASLINFWNHLRAYTEEAKQGVGRLYPCKRSNLQEGAMNARAWASQSLASVSLGEPSSGRAYSTTDRN
ncbi:hypothetical protein BHM03_00000853 [Ensete ventricosum]|uniref:Thioredoxin domain-containing protein n=1 Tax=Ensete ventricosum TaxID=4639 RepID=A0A445M8P7_ENSVE|nr:hypothetical protein BHM03_00000853 [Ensete ventricosum]